MPSQALSSWQNDRLPRLGLIDAQCAAAFAVVPPNPTLADENLRGYVMLLSAHFQGFCRDLHTECVQAVAAAVPAAMQFMIHKLGISGRELDGANPKFETIRTDFNRFGFDLSAVLAANPANLPRITHVNHLNAWRNYAAHHKVMMPAHGGPFTLAAVRGWKGACDGLTAELDQILYDQLKALTGSTPW